jgi:hypothetical protein
MKPHLSGPRAELGAAPGIQALIAADPLSLVLADLTQNIAAEDTENSTDRPSRRRKRTQSSHEDSETSKAVEAIRAAAKIALMSNERDDEDLGDDDEEDGEDDDLGDDQDEETSRKRRKTDDSSGNRSKDAKKLNAQALLSEEERRAKKKESNNVKKVKERQRRSKMSESIHELRRLLPQCRDDKKANQSVVMMRAVEYIKHLEGLLERALIENQKFRQAAASVVVAPQPTPLPTSSAPTGFDASGFPFSQPNQHMPIPFGEQRYGYALAADPVTTLASKSSAFCSPPRVFTPHMHTISSVVPLSEMSAFDTKVAPQPRPSAGTSSRGHAGQNSVEHLRSESPVPRHESESNAPTHASSHPRHRAGKAAKSHFEGSFKHPHRHDWPSKAPATYQPPNDASMEEIHLAGDIEEVDGEWPLFFQRPYLNSDFANDNHISLDIPQADSFGFNFDHEHDAHRHAPPDQERVGLDFHHAIR